MLSVVSDKSNIWHGEYLMEKLEISLTPELIERIDDTVEFLGYNSREELVHHIIRRFVDKYHSPYIKIANRYP